MEDVERTITMNQLLCLSLFISVGSDHVFPHCPVTSTLELKKEGSYYYYPIDLYDPPHIFEKERSDSFICKTYDLTGGPGHPANHSCTREPNFCPVTKTNVHDALRRTSPLARSSVCLLKEKLMKFGENVNFYASGGSVTLGVNADECCSSPQCSYTGTNHPECSWAFQLFLWMNRTFPANLKFISFAQHGRNSDFQVSSLKREMSQNKVRSFNGSDLIFLDHSVNDNESGGSSVANGLENLIRHFYLYSEPHNWPTIIVLDADPKVHKQYHGANNSDTYERITRYYDVPLWSYTDAVTSNYSKTQQRKYSKFLTFDGNAGTVRDVGSHPPSHVHWFMADLYADILKNDIEEYCRVDNRETEKLYWENVQMRNRTIEQLPPPLSTNSSDVECGNKTVLFFDYESIVNNLPTVGSYAFVPEEGSWALKEDKPGRPGGFIADNGVVDGSRVVFTLNITTEEFVKGKMELSLFVEFLRSYDNGGICQVRLCEQKLSGPPHGKHSGYLDGLWDDYETHRFSLPDRWSPESDRFSYKLCENYPGKYPIIDMSFHRQDYEPYRGRQKVKIMSVTACLV